MPKHHNPSTTLGLAYAVALYRHFLRRKSAAPWPYLVCPQTADPNHRLFYMKISVGGMLQRSIEGIIHSYNANGLSDSFRARIGAVYLRR